MAGRSVALFSWRLFIRTFRGLNGAGPTFAVRQLAMLKGSCRPGRGRCCGELDQAYPKYRPQPVELPRHRLRGVQGRRSCPARRCSRQIRRALIAANGGPVSGAVFMAAVYPNVPWVEWRWTDVRRSAARYAERVLSPRSRPLLWRARPGVPKIPTTACRIATS